MRLNSSNSHWNSRTETVLKEKMVIGKADGSAWYQPKYEERQTLLVPAYRPPHQKSLQRGFLGKDKS